jgi:UDP-N-acetylglucosamine--N-acetylmuramyl-(pentapeptide) pyrophosphoryl-undecaprenol N-acetylglucosamine transferase
MEVDLVVKVILTTGGTGGHIFPALAVGEELLNYYPDASLLFVGGEYGQERELATRAGLEYLGLPVRGFFGRGVKAVGALAGLLRSIVLAGKKIRSFKPDLIIGFGGYAAAASLIAGKLGGVPIMIHEQNSTPGIPNRFMGHLAQKICISLPNAQKYFQAEKTVLTGNPVRKNIAKLYMEQAQKRGADKAVRNLLVLGGSQGAMAINSAVLQDLPLLFEAGFNVRMQTGERDYSRIAGMVKDYPADRISVSAFIDAMDEAYAWADLALCRAGATTVAELAVASLAAVFIPFPEATHNHQYFNAQQMQSAGAALLLEQKEIYPGLLGRVLKNLSGQPDTVNAMSEAAFSLAAPHAAEQVVKELSRILDSRQNSTEKRGEENCLR